MNGDEALVAGGALRGRGHPPGLSSGQQNHILHLGLQSVIIYSVNRIGQLIESRRRHLGLSRLQLANRLGVSSQTVLNLERDPTYNLGTGLLRLMEEKLHVTFEVSMKERRKMSTTITMGNDEFILFIRKNHPNCATSNDQLGKLIWKWIKDHDAMAEQLNEDKCLWGEIGETKLPKTAMQFRFERKVLPELYEHLFELGSR